MKAPSKDGKRFEGKLEQLEEIVARLEAGDTTLEESLALFEKGTALLKDLTRILEEAERKVEVLAGEVSDQVRAEPVEEEV